MYKKERKKERKKEKSFGAQMHILPYPFHAQDI